MTWIKWSDTASEHEAFVDLYDVTDDEVLAESAAWLYMRLIEHSARHTTDGVVLRRVVEQKAGRRAEEKLRALLEVGLAWPEQDARGRDVYRLFDDPAVCNVLGSEEKRWTEQRKRDARNGALVVPVLLRDGSQCRYCADVLDWDDWRSDKAPGFDHREPGKPATVDTYVVCCRACNSARGDDPRADELVPLLAPPAQRVFSPSLDRVLGRYPTHVRREKDRWRARSRARAAPQRRDGQAPGESRGESGQKPGRSRGIAGAHPGGTWANTPHNAPPIWAEVGPETDPDQGKRQQGVPPVDTGEVDHPGSPGGPGDCSPTRGRTRASASGRVGESSLGPLDEGCS